MTTTQSTATAFPAGRHPRFLVEFEAHLLNAKIEAVMTVQLPLTRQQIADTLCSVNA